MDYIYIKDGDDKLIACEVGTDVEVQYFLPGNKDRAEAFCAGYNIALKKSAKQNPISDLDINLDSDYSVHLRATASRFVKDQHMVNAYLILKSGDLEIEVKKYHPYPLELNSINNHKYIAAIRNHANAASGLLTEKPAIIEEVTINKY